MDVAASVFYDEKTKQYDLNNKEPGKPHYVSEQQQRKTEIIMLNKS